MMLYYYILFYEEGRLSKVLHFMKSQFEYLSLCSGGKVHKYLE